jgi:hypothetical protein
MSATGPPPEKARPRLDVGAQRETNDDYSASIVRPEPIGNSDLRYRMLSDLMDDPNENAQEIAADDRFKECGHRVL